MRISYHWRESIKSNNSSRSFFSSPISTKLVEDSWKGRNKKIIPFNKSSRYIRNSTFSNWNSSDAWLQYGYANVVVAFDDDVVTSLLYLNVNEYGQWISTFCLHTHSALNAIELTISSKLIHSFKLLDNSYSTDIILNWSF